MKGLRWSSQSVNGVAAGNVLFDNHERGISVKHVESSVLRRNALVNNGDSQILVLQGEIDSAENCFENGQSRQVIADFFSLDNNKSRRYKTLAGYQKIGSLDMDSREVGCGPLPKVVGGLTQKNPGHQKEAPWVF